MPSPEQIDADRAAYDKYNKRIDRYRRYARGEQPLMLTENQVKVLGGGAVSSVAGVTALTGYESCEPQDERADNIVHGILSEGADRVVLEGIDVEEGVTGGDELKAFIDEVWVKNALDDLAGEQSYETLLAGNCAILVAWRPNGDPPTGPDFGRVVLSLEPWWDGDTGVWVFEGDEEQEPYAVKEVYARQTVEEARTNGAGGRPKIRYVYYENRIERWRRSGAAGGAAGGDWQADANERYPDGIMPWTRLDGTPLHIPLVPFRNAGRMLGSQGLSECFGGLTTNQDDLNLVDASAKAAAVLTAFQIVWMNNYPFAVDAMGNPVMPTEAPQFEPGAVFLLKEGGEAGAVPAGSVEQILKSKEDVIASICRAMRVPRHAIKGGDWPSGEALVRAEQPAVAAARRRAAKWGPAWATVFHRATELANHFGKRDLNEDALLTARFGDFERRDPLYVVQVEQAEADLERSKTAAQNDAIAARTGDPDLAARIAASGNGAG